MVESSRSAAVCGLFTRCITVGIRLLSLGGYVTAELDKTGEVTETLSHTAAALVTRYVRVHTHTHTHSHLGRPCCYLKPPGSSLTGLKVCVCNAICT